MSKQIIPIYPCQLQAYMAKMSLFLPTKANPICPSQTFRNVLGGSQGKDIYEVWGSGLGGSFHVRAKFTWGKDSGILVQDPCTKQKEGFDMRVQRSLKNKQSFGAISNCTA